MEELLEENFRNNLEFEEYLELNWRICWERSEIDMPHTALASPSSVTQLH